MAAANAPANSYKSEAQFPAGWLKSADLATVKGVSFDGLSDSQKAIALPPGSLASVAGQPGVWIVDPATRTVSARPITIARYETTRVVVAAGLRPGELVVTRDGQKMSPQQTVSIAEVH